MPDEAPRYRVVTAPTAARALANTLPLRIVEKYLEYKNGDLARNPHRVGSWGLDPPYEGHKSLRLGGEYRAIYWIDDDEMIVNVVAIGRRADIYRPGSAPS